MPGTVVCSVLRWFRGKKPENEGERAHKGSSKWGKMSRGTWVKEEYCLYCIYCLKFFCEFAIISKWNVETTMKNYWPEPAVWIKPQGWSSLFTETCPPGTDTLLQTVTDIQVSKTLVLTECQFLPTGRSVPNTPEQIPVPHGLHNEKARHTHSQHNGCKISKLPQITPVSKVPPHHQSRGNAFWLQQWRSNLVNIYLPPVMCRR